MIYTIKYDKVYTNNKRRKVVLKFDNISQAYETFLFLLNHRNKYVLSFNNISYLCDKIVFSN